MFENPQISPDELPDAASVDWQPMHKSMRTQWLIGNAIPITIVTIGLILFNVLPDASLFPVWISIGVFLTITLPLLIWPFIAVPRLGFAARDKDILYKSGVFFASVTAVPFNRVQHVETSHGPMDRRFGTANLQLFTAGGTRGDLSIKGMDADTAEKLRVFILEKIGASVERN